VLTAVATSCRDHQRLRFDDRHHRDARSVRVTEPHQLVTWGRRWSVVAWDLERRDWRTFRADRMRPRVPTGPRSAPREPGRRRRGTCLLHLGADTPHALAFLLGALEVDFDVEDSPEPAEQLLRTAGRYRRAVELVAGRAPAQ
jgi:WYL domain